MNETRSNNMKFLFGLAVGVVLGLIYAPARGEETRQRLMDKAGELADIPRQKAEELADVAEQKAGEIGARVGRDLAQSSVQAARGKVLDEKSA
jgi:gas vesicle protein